MAVNNYTTTLREWENIIRVNLKVTNPTLLKSGALGILSNYLASIKFDTLQYYAKTFQEMNPGLAQDFNSMLYHASIYGAEIQFATASTLSATLIVPEIMLSQVNTLTYVIPKNSKFTDTNGIQFITVAAIKIQQGQMNITATAWDEINGTQKLSITKAPNPNVPGRYVFLIHTAAFQQYNRIFTTYEVSGAPIVGQPYEFELGIPSLNGVKSIQSWINTGAPMSLLDLETSNMENLTLTSTELEDMNVKFYKFESSNRDNDLFVEMFESSLGFETGDGIHGALPESGSQIIVEVQTTLGNTGNVPNSEFLVTNVEVTERWANDSVKYFDTSLNGMSAAGSVGGNSVDDIDAIRDDIFTRISVRNSILTENDYEAMFQFQGNKPFIDAKFIDAQAFVFMFNVIHNNDNVVPSTSLNVKESWLLEPDLQGRGGPFYPEYDYAGVKIISPFYYKTENNNRLNAYMVQPKVDVFLRGDLRTPDMAVLADYKVEMAITYDFLTNSSFLEITTGAQDNLDYYFVCDQFRVTITSANNDNVSPFTYKIDTMFTDAYCIINGPLTGITVHVKNKQGQVLASYTSDLEYNQLLLKQVFYKYFQEVEEAPTQITSATHDVMAYLDNNNGVGGRSMSTMIDVNSQTQELNSNIDIVTNPTYVDKYILRMPFIDSEYFFSKKAQEIFEIMNSYFVMNLTQEFLNYNTLATQSFHNTIDIPPKYYDCLFEHNTMEYLSTPKIPIEIEIFADNIAFMTSKYDTSTEFDTAIRMETIKFLKQREGFTIQYFETDLEKYLYDVFSPLILNVAVKSPTLFEVNSSAEVYRNIEDTLDFQDMLDFIPPYFHYDYEGMQIRIGW